MIVTVRPKYACPPGWLKVGPHRRGSSQGPGTSAGGQLADRSTFGTNRRRQTFRTLGPEPAGGGHGPARRADRAVGSGRLDGPDRICRSGALIAPVVDRMAVLLKSGSTRLYVDETTAAVFDRGLDPGRGRTKTGYLWAVLRADRGGNGPAPPGVVFHYHPGRKGEYAD